jgi:hypothetical protein
MLTDLESLFPHVSPLHNPLEFLDSHAWDCARGIQLSAKGRYDLKALLANDSRQAAGENDLLANIRAMLSILECYAHSQVCTYCVPVHSSEQARQLAALVTDPVTIQTCEHTELKASLAGILDPALAQAARLSHQASCKVCRAKEQRARAGAPVWTMENARLQRAI